MEGTIESQFERIVGGTPDQKENAREKIVAWRAEANVATFARYERERTAEDERIIRMVENGIATILKRYGLETLTFPREKIFVLRPDAVREITKGESAGGFHSPLKQRVAVERKPQNLAFAMTVAHELLHANSYKAAQIKSQGVQLYRSGLTMVSRGEDDETEYFSQLEEAIVAEMEQHFYTDIIRNNPEFRRQVEVTDRIKPWLDKLFQLHGQPRGRRQAVLRDIYAVPIPEGEDVLAVLEGSYDQDYKLGYLAAYLVDWQKNDQLVHSARTQESEQFHDLLQKIVDNSSGRFGSTNEVFTEFAKAQYTGNLLPLARLVEQTLGKGAFRRMAEQFKESGL